MLMLLHAVVVFIQKNRNSSDGSSQVNTIYKVCLHMSCTQENGKSCLMHMIMESVLLGNTTKIQHAFSLLFLATYN